MKILHTIEINTYDPSKYLLVNKEDGTVWKVGPDITWIDSGLYLDDENNLLQRDP